jgi:hypothetical protein
MDLIREQLMYKSNTLHVCVSKLTRQEQYDFLRLVMATRKEGVTFCYDNSNQYVVCLLEKIGLERTKDQHQQN